MKLTITQKYPPIVDGTLQPAEVCTIDASDQIYYVGFISKWVVDAHFYRLCKCTLNEGSLLVVETNSGNSHWIIADIEGDVGELNLPEWKSL